MQLGQFPAAEVTRLKDWHWAIANPNIVLVSVKTVAAVGLRLEADTTGAALANQTAEDTTVQRYPELFRSTALRGCTRVSIGGHYVTVPVAMLAALRAMGGHDPDIGAGVPAQHTNDVLPD